MSSLTLSSPAVFLVSHGLTHTHYLIPEAFEELVLTMTFDGNPETTTKTPKTQIITALLPEYSTEVGRAFLIVFQNFQN